MGHLMESEGKKRKLSLDITSFFEEERKEEVVKGKEVEEISDIESQLYDFLCSSSVASKSEVYSWAKRNKIPPVKLYRAIQSLLLKSVIKREFDEERAEIVYRPAR